MTRPSARTMGSLARRSPTRPLHRQLLGTYALGAAYAPEWGGVVGEKGSVACSTRPTWPVRWGGVRPDLAYVGPALFRAGICRGSPTEMIACVRPTAVTGTCASPTAVSWAKRSSEWHGRCDIAHRFLAGSGRSDLARRARGRSFPEFNAAAVIAPLNRGLRRGRRRGQDLHRPSAIPSLRGERAEFVSTPPNVVDAFPASSSVRCNARRAHDAARRRPYKVAATRNSERSTR